MKARALAAVPAVLGVLSIALGAGMAYELQTAERPAQPAPLVTQAPHDGGGADAAAPQGASESPSGTELPTVSSQWLKHTADLTKVPQRALQSYAAAEVWAAQKYPQCGLGWTTLAGIGSVETQHGAHNKGTVGEDGVVSPSVLGPRLDGKTPGTAVIRDTDGGELDGDRTFDRAVGPMQFLPAVWKTFGVDGNGDGAADPNSFDDAAATAAAYLCADKRVLTTPTGWNTAILAYNPSQQYASTVWAEANRLGLAALDAAKTPTPSALPSGS